MRRFLACTFAILGGCLTLVAAPARADGTLLLGLHTPSAPRPSIGVSFGQARGVIGWEFEISSTVGSPTSHTSNAACLCFNVIVQPGLAVHGATLYAIAGAGLYGETGQQDQGSGEVGTVDLGAGFKVPLSGALKLRLDYRIFLGSAPDASPEFHGHIHSSRVAAGLSLAF